MPCPDCDGTGKVKKDEVIEGPHKGHKVHPAARYYVAPVDEIGELRYAHYSRTPEGFRFEGISRSAVTLRTGR